MALLTELARTGGLRAEGLSGCSCFRHAMDGDKLLTLPADDPGDVLLEFFFTSRANLLRDAENPHATRLPARRPRGLLFVQGAEGSCS